MGKRKVGALEKVDADLPNLQNKIRRDPSSYRDDFASQHSQYESFRELFMQAPTSATDNGIVSLRELIDFIAHVADCYPQITSDFPDELIQMLTTYHAELEPELREKIVVSLVLLRNKDVIDSSKLLNTLFPILVATTSKGLRQLLFQKVISDLRSSNAKTTNHRLNRTIQTALYNLLTSDRASAKGIWVVKLTRELWKRQIWTDAKAVEIMKEACLVDNGKVIVGAVRFFLSGDREREDALDESSDEDDGIDMTQLKRQMTVNKKSRKNEKQLKKAAATVKRKERKKGQPPLLNFSALHLLHDPQGFAEILFQRHLQTAKSKLNLEQRLLVLQLVSRLVGLHKLTIVPLYSYFLKFLTPRQPFVTSFLASLAQSAHDMVPPDMLEPLVQKIANEFVSEAAASEVAAAGLNSIREICARQPLAMSDTLLQDLVMYRKSKDKGVMMAAKGLLSLYRDVGADMLKRRDRGRDAALELRDSDRKERRFGEVEAGGIEGLELLEQWKDEERQRKRAERALDADVSDNSDDEAEDWKAWDVDDDDGSDDSGGWIDVPSDGDAIDISDSDNDKGRPPLKKRKGDGNEAIVATADATHSRDESNAPKAATSTFATTRILTPADLAKLRELQTKANVQKLMPGSRARKQTHAPAHADDPVTAETITAAAALSTKATKQDKIAAAKGDRDEKHTSSTAKRAERKSASGKSSTNQEKQRKKNFLMTLGKARAKNKRSLVETRKVLRGHVDRQKKGGRRGNR